MWLPFGQLLEKLGYFLFNNAVTLDNDAWKKPVPKIIGHFWHRLSRQKKNEKMMNAFKTKTN